MPITKVWIEEGCTVCGLCEEICPEVFEVEDTAIVKENADFAEHEVQIEEAAESCPVEVIQIEKT